MTACCRMPFPTTALPWSSLGFTPVRNEMDPLRIPDLDAVKSRAGLRLPSAGVTLRYSARIKTEAVVKLGCYTLVTLVKRLIEEIDSKQAGG